MKFFWEVVERFRKRVPKGEIFVEELNEFSESKLKKAFLELGVEHLPIWEEVLILQDGDSLRVNSEENVTIRRLGVEQQFYPKQNQVSVYQKYTGPIIPGTKTIFPKFPLPSEVGEWQSETIGSQTVLNTFKGSVEWRIEYDKSKDFVTKVSAGINESLMVREVYFDHPESSKWGMVQGNRILKYCREAV